MDIRLSQALIDADADVNTISQKNGRTALMNAAENGNVEIVKLLIAASTDIHARDRDFKTALIYAADRENHEAAKILIEAGADINHKNINGKFALMLAQESSEKIKILLNIDAH